MSTCILVGFNLLWGCSNVFRSQRKTRATPGKRHSAQPVRGKLFSIRLRVTTRPIFQKMQHQLQEAWPAGTSRTEHSQAFVNNHDSDSMQPMLTTSAAARQSDIDGVCSVNFSKSNKVANFSVAYSPSGNGCCEVLHRIVAQRLQTQPEPHN